MPDREDTLARMEKIMARVDKLEKCLDRIHWLLEPVQRNPDGTVTRVLHTGPLPPELIQWEPYPEENNDG